MLVEDLRKHDLILGRMWLAQHDMLLDCRRRRMIWPHEPTFKEVYNQVSLPTPITILKKPILTSAASAH
jgi:transcriptional regulator GlxA family with amidase domain